MTLRLKPVAEACDEADEVEVEVKDTIIKPIFSEEKMNEIRVLKSELLRAYQCLQYNFEMTPEDRLTLSRGTMLPWLFKMREASSKLIALMNGESEGSDASA